MPRLYEQEEDYCTMKVKIPCVANQRGYDIPKRAFNTLVRHAWILPAGADDDDAEELTWISPANKFRHTVSGIATHFWFENDQVHLNGTPEGTLILAFPFKPGELVEMDDVRIVSSVNTALNQITLTAAPPSGWGAGGERFYICDPERTGMPRYYDKLSTTIAGSVITLDSEIAGTTYGSKPVEEGDYVTLAGYAARPMVPEGLHTAVAQGICERIAQSNNDTEAFQIAHGKFQQLMKDNMSSLDQRVTKKKPLINYNSRFRRFLGWRALR